MSANMLQRPALILNRNWQRVNAATVARVNAGMELRELPVRSKWKPLYARHDTRCESWSKFIRESYLNVPLQS